MQVFIQKLFSGYVYNIKVSTHVKVQEQTLQLELASWTLHEDSTALALDIRHDPHMDRWKEGFIIIGTIQEYTSWLPLRSEHILFFSPATCVVTLLKLVDWAWMLATHPE